MQVSQHACGSAKSLYRSHSDCVEVRRQESGTAVFSDFKVALYTERFTSDTPRTQGFPNTGPRGLGKIRCSGLSTLRAASDTGQPGMSMYDASRL